ncbi:hypothetical protein D9M71_569030 [compost metagenome]
MRLGHADGTDHLAGGHARQVLLFLFLGAVIEDVVRGDVVHLDAEAPVAYRRLLLEEHRQVGEVAAAAAVFLGHVQRQQAQLAGLVPELAVDVVLLVPALQVRLDFLGEEAPHVVAEELQVGVHPGGGVGLAHFGITGDRG